MEGRNATEGGSNHIAEVGAAPHPLQLLQENSGIPFPAPPPQWMVSVGRNTGQHSASQVNAYNTWMQTAAVQHQQSLLTAQNRIFQQQITGRQSGGGDQGGQESGHGRRGSRSQRNRRASRRTSQQSMAAPFVTPVLPLAAQQEQQVLNLQEGVRAQLRDLRGDGTDAAYTPKETEYYDFCEKVYGTALLEEHRVSTIQQLPPQVRSTLYTVTPNKAYAFVHFHAYRKKRKGGRQNLSSENADDDDDGTLFDLNEYKYVSRTFGGSNPPHPDNPLGFSQVNIYSSTVFNIWKEQKARSANGFDWETDIKTESYQALMKLVS